MASSQRVQIKALQPIKSRGWLVAKTGTGEWDLRQEGLVEVVSSGGRVRMRYAGFGEIGGERLLTLVPLPGESVSITKIVAALGGAKPDNAFVERVAEAAESVPAQAGVSGSQ